MLADIHTQLDTKKLFDVRNYVDFLDDDESLSLLKNYQELRRTYLKAQSEYQKLLDEVKTSQDNLDFYQYRFNELKGLHLQLDEVKNLEQELYFEPKLALTAEDNGLYFYKQIAEKAKKYLNDNGAIFLELNANLSREIEALFKNFSSTKIIKDYSQKERVLFVRL